MASPMSDDATESDQTVSRTAFVKFRRYVMLHWLAFFGLTVGIAGLISSYFFYSQSIRVREPHFLVDSERVTILSADRVAAAPITVVADDGRQIISDLHLVRFFFWNEGREAIRRAHVLDPVRVTLTDSASTIVDLQLLHRSRDITGFGVEMDSSPPFRSVRLDFEILDYLDGATVQLIYQGAVATDISISGAIEGVQAIQVGAKSSPVTVVEAVAWVVGSLLVFVAAMILLGKSFDWVGRFGERLLGEQWKLIEKATKEIMVIVIVLMLSIFVGAFMYAAYDAFHDYTSSVGRVVPTEVRPSVPNN